MQTTQHSQDTTLLHLLHGEVHVHLVSLAGPRTNGTLGRRIQKIRNIQFGNIVFCALINTSCQQADMLQIYT